MNCRLVLARAGCLAVSLLIPLALVAAACSEDSADDDGTDAAGSDAQPDGQGSELCSVGAELSAAITSEAFAADDPSQLEAAYTTIVAITAQGASLTSGQATDDLTALSEGLGRVRDALAAVDYDFDQVDPSLFDEFAALAVPSSRVEGFFADECELDLDPDDYNGSELDEGGYVSFPVARAGELTVGAVAPGPDETLDGHWTACAGGDLAACDELYLAAPTDSLYGAFGATCGAIGIEQYGECSGPAEVGGAAVDGAGGAVEDGAAASEFGTGGLAEYDRSLELTSDDPAPGPDAGYDELWMTCASGDGEACNTLYLSTPIGSVYEAFGATCGGRDPEAFGGAC